MLWAFTGDEKKNQIACIETGALITATHDGHARLEGPGNSAVGDLSMSFDVLLQELKRRQVLVD